MKRLLALAATLPLFLTGCSLGFGRGIDTSNEYSTDLRDGVYTVATSCYDSLGYLKQLSIGVRRGLITQVSYTETDRSGTPRRSIPSSQHWDRCALTYEQILTQLYQNTIETQGSDFDAISGATRTCSDFEAMLLQAIRASEKGGPTYQETDALSDTYTIVNDPDPSTGSQEQMTVVFSRGKPISVDVREVTNNAAYYSIGRTYLSLADISTKLGSLDSLDIPNVDSNILERYNELLESIRSLRER